MGKTEKSHGAKKFDGTQDAQKSIQNLIQNDGAFMPSALKMIQNLRNVTNGQNPTSMQSVGPQNMAQALQALNALFKKKSSSSSNNAANTDPCSIQPEQRTPEQQYECEQQQALESALALGDGIAQTNTEIVTISIDTSDQSSNTDAYIQAIADVSNTVLGPVANSIVANAVMVNTIAWEVESFLLANGVAVNTIANAAALDVTTIIVANSSQVNTISNVTSLAIAANAVQVNTIANSMVHLIITTPTLAANVANSIQTPLSLDLLANTDFLTALKAALNALP